MSASRAGRRLDWRSGGWLLLLAAALTAAVVGWQLLPLLGTSSRAVGDGSRVASYGFDLADANVPLAQIVAAGIPKDGIPALVEPPAMAGREVAELNRASRGKYLVSADRVIGVVSGGEARAYPLRVLNWHEVVNDTLGGVPIAVTYHPLCDSVAVFDRRVGDETLEFGISGLLYDSNQLLYDRREDPEAESLWSQLLARAVAGPAAAAGRTLDALPVSLTRWDRWLEQYPETTVIEPDPRLRERYERDPYGNYFLTGRLRFPVDPLPPEGPASYMRHVVVIENDAGRWIETVPSSPGEGARWSEPLPGARVYIDATEAPTSVLVEAAPGTHVFFSLWFAWFAHHPEGPH